MIRESKILVVGLVRNCEKHVKQDVLRLKNALAEAAGLAWLLVESDSDDATVGLLATLSREIPDFDYISLGRLRDKIPLRTERIAFCRNAGLSLIRETEKYAGIDYVVVSDFDGMNKALTADGIRSCWRRSDWDVCTANQEGPYYDLWALRHPLWSPNDCFDQYRFLADLGRSAVLAYHASVYTRMLRIRPDAEWIEADSAFGGLAVYKREAFVCSQYVGVTSDGREVCEHVPFHAQIRRNGYRIFINPFLVNSTSTEHVFRTRVTLLALAFLGRRGFEWLRRKFR